MGTKRSLSMCILFPSDSGSGFGCQGHDVKIRAQKENKKKELIT